MKIVVGIVFAAILLLGGGAWLYLAQQRRAEEARELAEFDRALGRLEAGVEHESKILLRKTIADTAAAIDEYTKKNAARHGEPRAVAARHAIKDLEGALEDRMDYRIWQAEKLFSLYGDLGANELERKCAAGKLYIENRELESAYARAFLRDLAMARGKEPLLPAQKFVLAAATKACGDAFTKERAAHAAALAESEKKTAAERAAHLARFALHVEVSATEYTNLVISADGGEEYAVIVGGDEKKHLDAHSSIQISTREPELVRLSVNGKTWPATWARGSALGRLSTIIQVQDLAVRR